MNTNNERFLELAFKTVCDFEKSSCEEIFKDENNQVVYQLNKSLYLELENLNENDVDEKLFEPVKYPSYQKLFNTKYRDIFRRNIRAIKPDLLKNEIGEKNLFEVIKSDEKLRERFIDNIKELDLDNDGVVDRIDINDNRNAVQNVSDLNIVGNDTSKEVSRGNKKQDELEL